MSAAVTYMEARPDELFSFPFNTEIHNFSGITLRWDLALIPAAPSLFWRCS